MTIYAVLAPPARAGASAPETDRFIFVKEGFCWPAFYLTIPWLLWRRMWLVFIFYLLAAGIVIALAGRVPLPVSLAILLLFAVLVGLEANNLRRWTLERRGYRFRGVAAGDRLIEAEFRFFAGWQKNAEKQREANASEPVVPKAVVPAPAATRQIVGLFPTAGARP